MIDIHRLSALCLAGLALVGICAACAADPYPTHPIRFVVGFTPGGATDIVARIMGNWLTERLGQPVVIENKAGAAGNIATQSVIAAPADGHTLLFASTASAINTTFYEQLPFNFLRDVAPVASLVRIPNVIVVHPSLPVRNVPEFIAYAKANPGKINVSSAGAGTANHMAGELFKAMTGLDLVHVPYRGAAPAMTDLLSGRVQVMFDLVPNSLENIRTGKLRALAVTTTMRAALLPDVPLAADTVPGYEASAWFGVGVAKATAPDIVATLNREINAGLADATVKARLAELGTVPFASTPAEFAAFVAAETEKWGKVVKFSGLKAE